MAAESSPANLCPVAELSPEPQAVLTPLTASAIFLVLTINPGGEAACRDLLTDWSIQIFRSVPPISLIPLAILFLGIGDKPAISLIFLSGLWPLLINTIFGVRGIERTLIGVLVLSTLYNGLILSGVAPSLQSGVSGLVLVSAAIAAGWSQRGNLRVVK